MNIEYKINAPVTTDQFIELLRASTLAERRPVEDRECIEGMLKNSNLTVSAWENEKLIGIARAITDFHYACYLSDLAVDKTCQQTGTGKELQRITQRQLGPKCKLIVVSAPSANAYYEHIGYTSNPRCWVLDRNRKISD
ncbi:MAG TPA: GNAT family N-acetyltransferase [Gammaproteobacteria bacterium]|nr:GNAT family N-acetyltransferase [Gammaproteobacteria bacterium]